MIDLRTTSFIRFRPVLDAADGFRRGRPARRRFTVVHVAE
jgi:hypothetical protein